MQATQREINFKRAELDAALNQTEPCYNDDPELWMGNWVNSTDADTAQKLCAGCHALELCAQYAALAQEEDGIWGGLRPKDRLKGKKNLKQRGRTSVNSEFIKDA